MKQIKIGDVSAPVLGQGAWAIGDHAEAEANETEALTAGIKNGMTLIDTAELYGDGLSETLIGGVISRVSRRDLYIVSKVLPQNVLSGRIRESCDNSLKRLKTDYLDLYLLHWRDQVDLAKTVREMEGLKLAGKIKNWGVSNFDTADMQDLFSVKDGGKCAANQVLYHAASRGIEYDLMPWCEKNKVTVMAYCPLAQAGRIMRGILENPVLKQIAAKHNATAAQVMLRFCIRGGNVIAIPKSGNRAHTLDNARAADLTLDSEDLAAIDAEFPPPTRKLPLDFE